MEDTTAPQLLASLLRQGLQLSTTPDGALQVWPARALDARTRAAIAQHKHALLALLADPDDVFFADDRHRCRDCWHLQTKGNCAMAAQGRLQGVPRWLTPDTEILQRCPVFCALPY